MSLRICLKKEELIHIQVFGEMPKKLTDSHDLSGAGYNVSDCSRILSGQADLLRRAMGKKSFSEEMKKQREIFKLLATRTKWKNT